MCKRDQNTRNNFCLRKAANARHNRCKASPHRCSVALIILRDGMERTCVYTYICKGILSQLVFLWFCQFYVYIRGFVSSPKILPWTESVRWSVWVGKRRQWRGCWRLSRCMKRPTLSFTQVSDCRHLLSLSLFFLFFSSKTSLNPFQEIRVILPG